MDGRKTWDPAIAWHQPSILHDLFHLESGQSDLPDSVENGGGHVAF
jgi:hypothetical protein